MIHLCDCGIERELSVLHASHDIRVFQQVMYDALDYREKVCRKLGEHEDWEREYNVDTDGEDFRIVTKRRRDV